MNHMAPAELTQALLYMDGVCVSFDGFWALNTLSLGGYICLFGHKCVLVYNASKSNEYCSNNGRHEG